MRKKEPASRRIIFRLYPNQERQVQLAMGIVPDAWRGLSHFARTATLRWAAQVIGESVATDDDTKPPRKGRAA